MLNCRKIEVFGLISNNWETVADTKNLRSKKFLN